MKGYCIAFLMGLACCQTCWAKSADSRTNVVLLFSDVLGNADTVPFDCKDIPTPHIARMAQRHVEWKTTHVPPPTFEKLSRKNSTPTGHGWVISDGCLKPQSMEKKGEQ